MVTIDRLAQWTSISQFVLASALLRTSKLKGICLQWPCMRWRTGTRSLEKGFSGWNIAWLLQCYCPLKCGPHRRGTGSDMWALVRGFRAQSTCWVQAALARKNDWALLGAMPGWVTLMAGKELCLLYLGSLLSFFPHVERFTVWLWAVYNFFANAENLSEVCGWMLSPGRSASGIVHRHQLGQVSSCFWFLR